MTDLLEVVPAGPPTRGSAAKHVRGSTLLLGGRVIALVLNFVTQVATVRYLSKAEFGAFSWALSVVAIGTSINLLGLSKCVSRFVPIYEERGEHGTAIGTVLAAAAAMAGLGFALVVGAHGVHLLGRPSHLADPAAIELLLWLLALTPLNALDNLLQSVTSVFLGARAIFFRRHLLVPLLRVAAIGGVISIKGSVTLLAIGHVLIGIVGVLAYVGMLWRYARTSGLLARARAQGLRWNTGELLRYSLPLLSGEVVLALHSSVAVLILKHMHGASSVAALRAVAPVAALCLIAIDSFRFMYIPASSRLFARGDHEGVRDVYWNSALWIAVFSFPIFAVACFLANPVTTVLFGHRYATSGTLLALLAVGNYANSCTGLNLATLQVYGKVRLILLCNLLGFALNVVYCLLLIPRYGELGAAVATMGAVVSLNLSHQAALVWTTSAGRAPRAVALAYVRVLAVGVALAAVRFGVSSSIWVLGPAIAAASLWLIRANRDALEVDATFPELRKLNPFRRGREAREG